MRSVIHLNTLQFQQGVLFCSMSAQLKLELKSNFFGEKKELTIDKEFLKFDDKNFSKLEIAEIRYGIKAIQGYEFRIGRIYCIDVRNVTGDIIKIRLMSVYHINKKRLKNKYLSILNALFENYINELSSVFIKMFNNKIDFSILGVNFTDQGIQLKDKDSIITWDDLGTKNYARYYSLFSKSDKNKYRAFYYLEDWNTSVLYSVSRSILHAKKLI